MELRTFHTIVTDKGEQTCGDIGVSADEWLDLLRKEAAKQYIDTLLCFLREPGHEGSCTVSVPSMESHHCITMAK